MSPRDPSFDFNAPQQQQASSALDAPSSGGDETSAADAPIVPGVFDYLVLMAGLCFSMILLHLFEMEVAPSSSDLSGPMTKLFEALPFALRLTEGLILFWPVFFIPQKMRGRTRGLTAGEWLWILSWVGIASLTALSAWQEWGRSTFPKAFEVHADTPRKLWYVIIAPSMAALAVLLAVGGMVRRNPDPWTHTFSLALMIWPVLPLGAILALGKLA